VNHGYHALRVTALTPEEEARQQRLAEIEHQLVNELAAAELSWREYERRSARGEAQPEREQDLPERAVWPTRARLSNNGGTQSCALCLDDIPEPYTLCDTCGVRFASIFKERHGIDLEAE
jgi:hypothetical protein